MRALPEPIPLFPKPSETDHLSVWATAQDGPRTRHRGRYLAESDAHPAKLYPAIAAHAIASYTSPGDLVIAPMCGVGTTLVEAMHADRMAIGVEREKRWADLAARNVEDAVDCGAPGYGSVVRGDARSIEALVGSDVHGKAALVLTSPPYDPATHGRVRVSRDSGRPGIEKSHDHYGDDPNKLACAGGVEELVEDFTRILSGCRALLRPGGFLVLVSPPFRRLGQMVDIPTMATNAALAAGFTLHERCVALLAARRDDGPVAQASFFQLVDARNAFAAGNPTHVTAHKEIVVARVSGTPTGTAGQVDQPGCGYVPAMGGAGVEMTAAA